MWCETKPRLALFTSSALVSPKYPAGKNLVALKIAGLAGTMSGGLGYDV